MATAYLTEPELQAYLQNDLLTRSDVTQRQAQLDRAASEADSYMRSGGYATPVDPTEVTPAMQGAVADIARYHLATVLQLVPEPASSSSLYVDYQAAIDWWTDVASGKIAQDAALAADMIGSPGEASIATNASREWRGGW